MNHSDITTRIVPLIVSSRDAWNCSKKDGWMLKVGYVNDELGKAREALFYDEVYFPKMRRLLAWVRAFDILPDADWQLVEVGCNQSFKMLYPNNTECQEWLDEVFGPYFDQLSQNEHWYWEQLKEPDIWEFCQKPGFVTEQLSLFSMMEQL